MKLSLLFLLIMALFSCSPLQALPISSTTSTNIVYPTSTTLEEAAKIIGVPVPLPDYLPAGYIINEVVVTEPRRLYITFAEPSWICFQSIVLYINWAASGGPFGIKLTSQQVDMSGGDGIYSKGIIVESMDSNNLWWDWKPDTYSTAYFEFGLSASTIVPVEELIQMGKSIHL